MPRRWAAVLFFVLFALHFALFMGRSLAWLRSESILAVAPGFYTHVSNYSLSYMLFTGIGYLWLAMGVRIRRIALFGVAIALANVVYELAIPILNTIDPVDAVYGLVGTAVSGCVLLLIGRRGMVANPAHPTRAASSAPQTLSGRPGRRQR
ncbi:MAG: hypothetical protein ABI867_43445 [Kofleriaceae bacterium]